MTAPGIEGLTVVQWAIGRVKAAGVPRVFQDEAPASTPYPLAVVSVPPALPTGGVGTTDWLALLSLTVRLTTSGRSYDPLIAPWRAVYASLTADAGNPEADVTIGGRVLTIRRTTTLQYPERTNGEDFRHLGGTFEVYAQ